MSAANGSALVNDAEAAEIREGIAAVGEYALDHLAHDLDRMLGWVDPGQIRAEVERAIARHETDRSAVVA